METFSEALLRITKEVGEFKIKKELEAYINALPLSYKSNALLKGLFQKRLTKLSHANQDN